MISRRLLKNLYARARTHIYILTIHIPNAFFHRRYITFFVELISTLYFERRAVKKRHFLLADLVDYRYTVCRCTVQGELSTRAAAAAAASCEEAFCAHRFPTHTGAVIVVIIKKLGGGVEVSSLLPQPSLSVYTRLIRPSHICDAHD